jgi:hypothetical protein
MVNVCEICGSWMQERPEYPGTLRCSCGHQKKIIKKIIKPVGKKT